MRETFLPFSQPSIIACDIATVINVLQSGWITTGAKCAEFEQAFADYAGCRGAVAVTSATAGMHLLLHAMDIGPGDEVVTPSMTWVSTVNQIVLRGATPVFADIDNHTLMVTAESIEPCLNARTRLIIPVHFAGASVDSEAICGLADEKGIPVVEDAAHAVGTFYKGVPVGGNGVTSIFSFHPIKNITTGEGGMICSDDRQLLDRIRSLRFHGLGVDSYDRTTQGRAPQAEVLEPGYKYNMTDFSAALGISQLERLDELIQKRTCLAERYGRGIAAIKGVIPLALPDYDIRHAWHLYVVRIDPEATGINRDDLMRALRQRNIGSGIHFKAVHRQKYYRDAPACTGADLPNTEWNTDRLCSLPLFPEMTETDVDDVITSVQHVINGASR